MYPRLDVAEVLLFHHAQGQTPGFLAFADDLRAAGHTVHVVSSAREATSALKAFDRWSIRTVPRALNAHADALVNEALDQARKGSTG